MDAITLLKQDHQSVEKLFKRFEKAGPNAIVEKREIVDRIIEELSMHAAVEEQLFYPVTRQTVPECEDVALESLEEHHIVKWVLSELDGMDPTDERFDAKVTVLMENVRHHVEEEEGDYFPLVRAELGRNALGELGDAMEKAKAVAPTHPHPRSPDTPPGNLVAGTASGVVDRVTDTVSGVAQGSLAAVQDVVARVTGAKKRARSPRGNSTAHKAASTTRSGVADLTQKAVEAVQEAKRVGQETIEDGTTATRAKARKATSAAQTTAKGAARTTGDAAKGASRGARSGAKGAASAGSTGPRSAAKGTKGAAKGAVNGARSGARTSSTRAKAKAATGKR